MSGQYFIVKRNRNVEAYDSTKLARSLAAACLSVRTPEGQAKDTAKVVCRHVEAWLTKKTEVTSADIRRKAAEALLAHNPDAAYMYKKDASAKIKRK